MRHIVVLVILSIALFGQTPKVNAENRVAFKIKTNKHSELVTMIPFFPVTLRVEVIPSRPVNNGEILACEFEKREKADDKEKGQRIICDKGYEFRIRAFIFDTK